MANISADQLRFLAANNIDIALLYDASGQSWNAWRDTMKKIGKKFAFGTSACAAGGHTLRTRHGHCIQCKPEQISYALRYSKPGQVYILGAKARKLIKIGVTTDLEARLNNLKSMSYGGADDWSALAITDTVASAGRIEAASHKHLEAFKTAGESNRAGENRITYELYRCTFDQAKSALERSAPKGTKIVSKASPLVQNAFNH